MKSCLALFLAAGLSFAADAPKKFTGVIGDDMCKGDHKSMGGTDPAKCVADCVKTMGAKYALWSGSDVYTLSDQGKAAKFVGRKVTVTGTLKGSDLAVKSIAPAK